MLIPLAFLVAGQGLVTSSYGILVSVPQYAHSLGHRRPWSLFPCLRKILMLCRWQLFQLKAIGDGILHFHPPTTFKWELGSPPSPLNPVGWAGRLVLRGSPICWNRRQGS